ncbi:MAG: RNA polymerase sigma factor, partial [Ramlibacter sp.]|nr:RNA polymerase sigma factor [Ramlibacter sp.]
LRELAPLVEQAPPQRLSPEDQLLLARYAERFNARDFDGLRALLGEDVRLDLVGRRREIGRPIVSAYYGNYAKLPNPVRAEPGVLEGRPVLWIYEADATGSAAPAYVIVLRGTPDCVEGIRDFRYARYVMDGIAP